MIEKFKGIPTDTLVERYNSLKMEQRVREARGNIKAAYEFFMKDEDGASMKMAPIHMTWHKHIKWCMENNLHCGILAPWGHGKSIQVAVGLPLIMIADNLNLRIKIVCAADEKAKERVSTIGKYITESVEYKRLYSHVRPAERGNWNVHQLFVQRSAKSLDPSIAAYGATSSVLGGRCDILIGDDIVDEKNAIQEPSRQDTLKSLWSNTWTSRLEPTGTIIIIGTVWTEFDLYSDLVKNSEYSWLIQGVSEDYTCIESTLYVPESFEGTM